jgi:hypothetical protein
MLLYDGPGLISEMKIVLTFLKDEEDHNVAQFHKEEHSICDVASKSTAEKTKIPICKIRVGLVPLRNVKAVTHKVNTRRNISS